MEYVVNDINIRIIVVHYKSLPAGQIGELLEQLDELDLDRDERRNLARDLQRLKMYEGFVSALDLSFDNATQTYLFNATTSWYKELLDILQQFEVFSPGFGAPEDIDDEPISGGYFSKN